MREMICFILGTSACKLLLAEEAVSSFVEITETVCPDKALTALYEERYGQFKISIRP